MKYEGEVAGEDFAPRDLSGGFMSSLPAATIWVFLRKATPEISELLLRPRGAVILKLQSSHRMSHRSFGS